MRCDILGVSFDCLTLDTAVAQALSFLTEDKSHTIVTPNAEIVWMAGRDERLRQALNTADLVLPDGVGVVRAARKLGYPICERVAGIDFAGALLPPLARQGTPLFLYGGRPGVADQAAIRVTTDHPGLNVVGTRDGYTDADSPEDIAAVVRDCGAHVLFVCLGAPKQELFMQRHGRATGARLLVGLGGTLDVWSGNVARAPRPFVKFGLEWLYRLIRQPRRLSRAFRLPAFLLKVRRQKSDMKKNKRNIC